MSSGHLTEGKFRAIVSRTRAVRRSCIKLAESNLPISSGVVIAERRRRGAAQAQSRLPEPATSYFRAVISTEETRRMPCAPTPDRPYPCRGGNNRVRKVTRHVARQPAQSYFLIPVVARWHYYRRLP
jgi:hypothetical protein